MVTGVDDHSRFCVAAGLVTRATSKAVCGGLVASLGRYGVPEEVLTDNGKDFTGRFGPRPVEVLFERILRENGISQRLTGVRSPTTTGKIERFHQSLRREFLADRTFASLPTAQAALDAWVHDYNSDRPHQALEWPDPGRAVPPRSGDRGRRLDLGGPSRGPHRPVGASPRGLQRLRLRGQPGLLGRQRVQGRARGRVRRRHDDPGLEPEPPDQDHGQNTIRAGAQGEGRRTSRQASAGYEASSIRWNLTRRAS